MIITGAAGRKLKTKLVDEQEIVMNLADIMAMAYMCESALLRIKKLKTTGVEKDLDIKIKATQLYIYEALEIARRSAYEAIDSFSSGVEKFALRRVMDGLLRGYDVNPKDLCRSLADAAIAANDYPL